MVLDAHIPGCSSGSLPVMAIGLAQDYQTFMLLRLAIGIVGASFVVTQYHTSIMFAPNVVGAANATTAGWGNVGAGVTQVVMPLLLGVLVALGLSEAVSWRLAMVFPGLAMLAMGLAYFRYTSDTPEGEFARGSRELAPGGHRGRAAVFGTLVEAARDRRVWALFVVYGACFGIELTINNIAVLYYHDRFGLSVTTAGMIAGSFGLTNVFARTLGGALSDRSGRRRGGGGRVAFLGAVLFLEGVALVVFSRMGTTLLAVPAMMTLGVFVQLANGATFAVVPFVNRRALGSVAGIVGAGGNAGAIAAGFLLRVDRLTTADALLVMGIVVASASLVTMTLRIRTPVEASTAREAW